jgi:protein CpxP
MDMKKLHKSILIAMTVIGLGATAVAARADMGDCGHMGRMGGYGHGQSSEKMQERMAKHQADLHAKLKLSAAQEPAWKTFTDSMKPGQMMKRPDRAEMEKLPAPERMEKMLGMMKDGEGRMSSHLAALKTFYATLTPEQKKTFDANSGPRGGHMGGKR